MRFEELPEPHAKISDLDVDTLSRVLKRTVNNWALQSFGLIGLDGDILVPTNAAIIVASPTPSMFIPSAHIRCARFSGTVRAHIEDRAEIDTLLPAAPGLVSSFLRKNLSSVPEFSQLLLEETPVPFRAIRELVTNAIVHADFSDQTAPIRVALFDDRIEIENPGTLLPGVTPESMKLGVSRLRNPLIAHAFREMSLMEDWGTGFGHVVDELYAHGLPEPKLEELSGVIRVTVFLTDTGVYDEPEPEPSRAYPEN